MPSISRFAGLLGVLVIACLSHSAYALTNDFTETREIIYSAPKAKEIDDHADKLASAVLIYEYVRNNYDYSLYFGSRSSSINTYLGKRGNDVDLATLLIAMFRARGVPAHYAVGNVRVPAANLKSWLQVRDLDLAVKILDDQGIQKVVKAADNSYVEFEHVWVEAYVPYGQYRGAASAVCSAEPAPGCNWVSLDPSFKQYSLKASPIDIYAESNAPVAFNYDAYYNAIKNKSSIRDKNPLEIYEEQIQTYLNANQPGKTLEDVADDGEIVTESLGLLPASLPYDITGTIRRYSSIDEHDQAVATSAELKKWGRVVKVTLSTQLRDGSGLVYDQYGNPKKNTVLVNARSFFLSDLTTQRLTLSFGDTTDGCASTCAIIRKDGVVDYKSTQSASSSDYFVLDLALDGAPATTTGGTDEVINASYYNFISAGYYLIGTGGETSNWSQVHRAANNLLTASASYGEVTGNADRLATDELTGGLLQTAMTQYFAKFHDTLKRLDHLNHVISPIGGFVGVVSSVYDVEYVDGTAFSVLPGGLLIDMKGQRLQGSWRNNAASNYAQNHFLLLGHAMSSLEHEIWQELTGFDAVSTVRGIQMAMNQSNAQLVNPKNVPSNNLATELPKFGLNNSVNLRTRNNFDLYSIFFAYKSGKPMTWYASDYYINTLVPMDGAPIDLSFNALKKSVTSSDPQYRKNILHYDYFAIDNGSSLYDWLYCYYSHHTALYYAAQGMRYPYPEEPASAQNYALNPNTRYGTYTCARTYIEGYPYTETIYKNGQLDSLWHKERAEFLAFYNNNLSYLTALNTTGTTPFVLGDYFYRNNSANRSLQTLGVIASIRDNIYLNNQKLEYVMPSQRTVTDYNQFMVYLAKGYDSTGTTLESLSFSIQNWGGGYVSGLTPLIAATSVPGSNGVLPTFDNATLTDQNTIAEANNNTIRTPSTADPVSTVTGNNYHDETDFTIKGRNGLNYAFTRTYNSAPSATRTDLGLGFGWVHSYSMRLKSNDYGDCANCLAGTNTAAGERPENGNNKTASITYTDERGGDHNYLVNESTLAVTPPAGEFDALVFNTPVSGQHTLTFRNGVKYIFEGASNISTAVDVAARLKQIVDPYGNQLNFSYNTNGRLTAVTDNLGISGRSGLVFAYDVNGHLQQVSDWSGRHWNYVVDANGDLMSMTNPLTQITSYTYAPGTHNLNQIIKPLQRGGKSVQTAFAYYKNGKTFNYANTLGDTETLDYDLYRKSTRVTDPRGGVREYEYDASGRLLKLTEPDGAILQFSNNPDGLRNTKADGLGYKTQYSYRTDKTIGSASDTYGNVTREQDALNQTVDTTYGIYDQVASVMDKRGTVFTTGFHASTDGTCKAIGKPDTVTLSTLAGVANVKLRSYCWNSDGSTANVTEYLDSAAATYRRTSTAYDSAAHLNVQQVTVSGSDGLSVSKTYTYDNLGRKTSETLNRRISPTNAATTALSTSYEYDALDRVTAVIDVYGNRMETVYDANGQVYQQIARYKKADGSFDTRVLSTRTYDAADRLLTDTDTLGGVTRYGYDEAGNVASVTDPENHTTNYEYDAMNRRTAAIDGNGHRVSTKYDLAGHPVAVTNGNGEITRTTYDNIGRPIQVTDPHGNITQTQYDANNNVTCVIDANAQAGLQPKNTDGCTVSTVYDELNRPIQSKDAQNHITKTAYDLLGNVTAITDPKNHTTAYIYDPLGRLIQITDPLGKATTYARDEAGNAWQITNRRNGVTQVTYDALNRPTRYDYLQNDSYQTTTYSIYGNVMAQANYPVSYSYTHDALNRLKTKTDSRGMYLKSLAFNYDKSGRILSKSTYQNTITSYTYDGTGRLAAITNPDYLTVNYQFDGAGRLLSRIMSSGAKSLYQYDANGQLLHLTHTAANGATLTDIAYTRDKVGNILTQTDSTGTTTFTYDPLYRLTSADYPGIANDESFTYDEVGNRLTHTKGGTARYYSYLANSNRLSDIRLGSPTGTIESAFTFDDEGRLSGQTGVNARIPHWDAKGRLYALTAGGRTEAYVYDPTDHRIKRYGGTLGNLDYYLEGEHLESVDTGGKTKEKYFRGASIDELVAGYLPDSANSSNLTPVLFQHDGAMSVVAISDPDGTTVQTSQYSAFGATINTTGSSASRLKYTGREDDGTGLYYYRARYYDPTIGRFISEDPLQFQAGINFYAYVNNNPVNANDPTGLAALDFNLGIVGGSIGIDNASGLPFYSFRVGLTGVGATINPLRNAPSVAGLSTPGQCTYCTVDTVKWQTANIGAGATIGPVSWQPIQYDVPAVVNQYKNGTWVNSGVKSGEGLKVDLMNFSSTFNGGKTGLPLSIDLEANYEQGSTLRWSDVRSFLGLTPLTGSTGGSAAAGGFLLYPNKPNTNQIQSVYSK